MIDFTFDKETYKLLEAAAERRGMTLRGYFNMLSGVEELKQIEEQEK